MPSIDLGKAHVKKMDSPEDEDYQDINETENDDRQQVYVNLDKEDSDQDIKQPLSIDFRALNNEHFKNNYVNKINAPTKRYDNKDLDGIDSGNYLYNKGPKHSQMPTQSSALKKIIKEETLTKRKTSVLESEFESVRKNDK